MKYHSLFVSFEKVAKFKIVVSVLLVIGGALRVKVSQQDGTQCTCNNYLKKM